LIIFESVRRSKVELMGEQGSSTEKLIAKLDLANVKILFELMRMSKGVEVSTHPQPVKLDLQPVNLKLDGPTTYLSWSHPIKGALEGRNLKGFLIGEEEQRQDTHRRGGTNGRPHTCCILGFSTLWFCRLWSR
jgi:hypothetical protein